MFEVHARVRDPRLLAKTDYLMALRLIIDGPIIRHGQDPKIHYPTSTTTLYHAQEPSRAANPIAAT